MAERFVGSSTPPEWRPRRFRAGGWTITSLMDAWFRLDGGAMWGVVPKVLWSRMTPAADDNTILLAARPFLAQRDGVNVVVEGGIGQRWDDKSRAIYHIEPTWTLERSLNAVGVGLGEIDHVVASHCHFDHIGALVVERGGALEPLFPRATHHFPAAELEAARAEAHPRRASYRPDDIEPIERSGRLELTEGHTELLPGLTLEQVGGHSEGMTVVLFGAGDDGPTAAFWGDLIPTTHHVQPPYIMAYDVDVPRSFAQRTAWLARFADEGIVGLSYHDPDRPFTRLVRDGRRYVSEVVAELEDVTVFPAP